MARRVKIVCKDCGSDDVVEGAFAKWDVSLQRHVLANLSGGAASCNGCANDDATLTEVVIDKPEADQARPLVGHTVFQLTEMVEKADPATLRAIGHECGYRTSFKAKKLATTIATQLAQLETV